MTTPPFAVWYVCSSNGTDGFLLDLIRRPEAGVLRMAVYHQGCPPRLIRQEFPLSDLEGVPGELKANLHGIALDSTGGCSTYEGVQLDAQFSLSGRSMRFVPGWASGLFKNVPDFRSYYGTLLRGQCEGAAYVQAPLVYSTYATHALNHLASARWVLMTAPRFPGSDLAFEISATRKFNRWVPAAWLFYAGREFHLNSILDSLLFRVRIGRAGELEGGERVFTASIRARGLRLDIEARAPADQFVLLDAEGEIKTWTTLFGTCRAYVAYGAEHGRDYTSGQTCLLEIRN